MVPGRVCTVARLLLHFHLYLILSLFSSDLTDFYCKSPLRRHATNSSAEKLIDMLLKAVNHSANSGGLP